MSTEEQRTEKKRDQHDVCCEAGARSRNEFAMIARNRTLPVLGVG
jgi:hypothetical protein